MDLLRRYLNAVKFWLPAKQQDDIIAELSEDLLSVAEAREAALGRELTESEWESVLKQRGSPILVANRYLPQRYLIGPLLFPVYSFVLKIVLICAISPSILGLIGMVILLPAYRAEHSGLGLLASVWANLWLIGIPAVFMVTLVFSILERSQVTARWFAEWKPSKLPQVRDKRHISRATSLFELITYLVFALWAGEALVSPVLFDLSGVRMTLTSAGWFLLSGFVLLSVVGLAISFANFLRPYWTRTRHTVRAAAGALTAILFAWAVNRQLLDVAGTSVTAANAADIAHAVNTTMSGILLCGVAISLLCALWEVRQALRQTLLPAPVDHAGASIY